MPPGRFPPSSSAGRLGLKIAILKIAILFSLGLAGCSSGSREQLDLPPNARGIIIANKSLLWRDLESIRNASIAAPLRHVDVWRVCVRLDTKGAFGVYTGERDYLVAIYGGSRPPELVMEDAALSCAAQPRVPFPELEGSYLQKDKKAKPSK